MSIHSGTPPPPHPTLENGRVCDHNAMLAYPQEKISHYTTGVEGGGEGGLAPPPLKLVKV